MTGPIEDLAAALDRRLAELPPEQAHRGPFLATYRRTTLAVGAAVERGFFEDADWVRRWTGTFGRYYLDAHDAALNGTAPARPCGWPSPWPPTPTRWRTCWWG